MVECSPATRAARVRFPDDAINGFFAFNFRFLYLFAGPPQSGLASPPIGAMGKKVTSERGVYADLGVSFATAVTDRKFACAIYNAKSKDEIAVCTTIIKTHLNLNIN